MVIYQGGGGNLPPKQQPYNNTHKTAANGSHEDEGNNNNSSGEQDSKKDVVVVLIEQGISENVAQRLANRYKQERIDEKIQFLEFIRETEPEKAKNQAGWLRTAIEENWAAPDGFMSKEERERQKENPEEAYSLTDEWTRIIGGETL